MRFVYKREYLKRFDAYPVSIQQLILETDQQIKLYLLKQTATYGLRIRKIGPNTFEARASDRIRIVWVKKENAVFFALLGTHDEVRRFIRQL